MSLFASVTAKCNASGCKNELSLEGDNATNKKLKVALKKAGWYRQWHDKKHGGDYHLCPKHKGDKTNSTRKTAKASKPAKKAAAKKPAVKRPLKVKKAEDKEPIHFFGSTPAAEA